MIIKCYTGQITFFYSLPDNFTETKIENVIGTIVILQLNFTTDAINIC